MSPWRSSSIAHMAPGAIPRSYAQPSSLGRQLQQFTICSHFPASLARVCDCIGKVCLRSGVCVHVICATRQQNTAKHQRPAEAEQQPDQMRSYSGRR